jgi:hypothetical protein
MAFFLCCWLPNTGAEGRACAASAATCTFRPKDWKPEWLAVTGIIESKALTLLISAQEGAEIELRAKGQAPIDFGNVKIAAGLEVASEKLIGTKVIGKNGIPFLRLAAVRRKWPWTKHKVDVDLLAEEKPEVLADVRDQILKSDRSLEQALEFRTLEGEDGFLW